ncbi:Putative 1-phosphatidylinositol-3-phosphate 5-kinase [Trachymyrmex zeteki]|uniref:1-phosphatidylinositol-3-phosphate 5-kinase n=1 Tax=Mycetomoellerius zeteki TaxID=64791 RepID=A0A151X148_9HYME|nr:Putative 1-phosphatidylinositol-3-phosphate 5-kinase [Trachymyrmex zeteki]
MNKNMNSPSKLTEFAPLSPEESQPVVASLFSKFFSFTRNNANDSTVSSNNDERSSSDSESWKQSESTEQTPDDDSTSIINFPLDTNEGRSLPNVLKRISNIVALKSNNLRSYKDSQLRSYWMPDSVSKQCYECGERFTTFRRRHHCRVCGQIFCSKCCSDQIPGKIMGCTGDLRVCTYCCKVVLSYLQSSDMRSDLSADLKALQEDLQVKYGNDSPLLTRKHANETLDDETSICRKPSVGYMEENYATGRSSGSYLTSQERSLVLQNSASLRMIWEELFRSSQAIQLQTHRIRLKSYHNCFLANELVNWMIAQNKAATRVQATAIGQALLEAGFIESVVADYVFSDSATVFRPVPLSSLQNIDLLTEKRTTCDAQEPAWVKTIPQHDSATDSESETRPMSSHSQTFGRLPSSSSSFYLDLNLEASTVTLKRPTSEDLTAISVDSSDGIIEQKEINLKSHDCNLKICDDLLSDTLQVHEFKEKNGWHRATNLRTAFGELSAYECLTSAYKAHEDSLIKQLLSKEGLSQTWSNTILSIAHQIIDHVRPDLNHDADNLDIRQYVQFKKCPGDSRDDCEIVSGIICSKNIAHRGMDAMIAHPKILLLQCGLMYQRVEGKLISLEPVMMQENEYLGHTVARITALGPDVVLIHRSVARLAQDRLRECGVTLVLNVKLSILKRVARCTGASIVNTIDAHISARYMLGTCKKFYLRNFPDERRGIKTLMYFEGCANPHLGATIVLRGGSQSELKKVKNVTSMMIFAAYSWRLEKSFLMDEFAKPPSPKDNSFLDETSQKDFSNDEKTEKLESYKISSEEKRIYGESISDRSDPLHQYLNEDDEDVFNRTSPTGQRLSVADFPLFNKFKKALQDTVLSVSPYLKFSIPYLETELGRNCVLRSFFPREIYYSEQFLDKVKEIRTNSVTVSEQTDNRECVNIKLKSQHPFVQARLTTDVDNREVQSLLANFRACGNRLYPTHNVLLDKMQSPASFESNEQQVPSWPDCLDPNSHQRLSVLFCSFSHTGNDTPAFCVNPWVVNMTMYGQNDIALGRFLERYCLTTEYKCPAQNCRAQIAQHVRRFAHDGGCMHITLSEMSCEPFVQEDTDQILMWSKCVKCKSVSPVVPMSGDTWCLSFAKYLELRFYGGVYTKRGMDACQHSLHHDHYQYFTRRNMLAVFKFTKISQWEISLPPPLINITYDPKQHANVIEEMKIMTLKGDEVFSAIREKLTSLQTDLEGLNLAKQQLAKDQQYFKNKIEEIQLKLTSPTLENKKLEESQIEDLSPMSADYNAVDAIAAVQSDFQASEVIENSDNEPAESANNPEDVVTVQGSPKMHQRSHSDVLPLSSDDVHDKKKKKKTILSQLLPSVSVNHTISNPLGSLEHYLLPLGSVVPIVVYESELSSIIAYALDSHDYKHTLQELLRSTKGPESNPSPLSKRKFPEGRDSSLDLAQSNEFKRPSVLSFFRGNSPNSASSPIESDKNMSNVETSGGSVVGPDVDDDKKATKQQNYIEVQFNDATTNFFCRIYFAAQFAALRENVLPCGEDGFTRSLSRTVQWAARGGKSGSAFCKSRDDRFIIKEMSRLDMQIFLDFAPNYFAYMERCQQTKQPTLLGKIIGVYRVSFKNNTTNAALRTSVLVMENLFYNRIITDKFDLKGSVRNRLANPDDTCHEGELVLLDENLLNMSCDSPLYIRSHSKAVLNRAIEQDTKFLADNSVMDYSLLVGLEPSSDELVLGIIDYIRTFTWDKKLETMVKKSGILGGQGKLPTIISPQEYRDRFIAAMHRYFLPVPDRWSGLGRSVEIPP